MRPLNGFVMLKKKPAVQKSKLVLSEDAQEEITATGFEVLAIAKDVTECKVGDVVFPGYAEEARKFNGFIFCKACHLVACEDTSKA